MIDLQNAYIELNKQGELDKGWSEQRLELSEIEMLTKAAENKGTLFLVNAGKPDEYVVTGTSPQTRVEFIDSKNENKQKEGIEALSRLLIRELVKANSPANFKLTSEGFRKAEQLKARK